VAHLLAELDLAGLADRRPTDCSGGQAQRVAVARALAGAPDVLLLDEPSTALDAESRRRIYHLLEDGERPATLLVTHDPSEAAGLADRVVELATGQVVGDAP
jgi:molybdate transport system ATP-binding protein